MNNNNYLDDDAKMMDYTRSVKAAEDAWRVDAYYGSRLVERKSRRCRRAAASRSGRRGFPAEDLALRVTNTRFPTSCRRGPVDRTRRGVHTTCIVGTRVFTLLSPRRRWPSRTGGRMALRKSHFFSCRLISIFFLFHETYSVAVVMPREIHTTRRTRNSVRLILLYVAEWKDINIMSCGAHARRCRRSAHNT